MAIFYQLYISILQQRRMFHYFPFVLTIPVPILTFTHVSVTFYLLLKPTHRILITSQTYLLSDSLSLFLCDFCNQPKKTLQKD